jgi:hypothetical protein
MFLAVLVHRVSIAQTGTPEVLDESNSSATGNANAGDYAEVLGNYLKHPININVADRGTFNELQLLTSIQINTIIQHRIKYGNFISIFELQSLPGFDMETIKKILPYITVYDNALVSKEKLKDQVKGGKHTLVISYEQPLQRAQGFLNGADSNYTNDYLGSNIKTNIKYRYTNGSKFSMGFSADKDIGEPFFNSRQPSGFDFYSAHLYVKDIGLIKQLVIGDYHLSLGQGLGIGSGFVLNKSIEVLQIHRYASGLRPYRSMNEFGFFRGAATTIGSEKFSTTLYASVKKVDGNTVVTDTTLFPAERYYNLIQSGYHRTARELALKNTSTQKVFGAYIQTQLKKFHAGIGYVNDQLSSTTQVAHADMTYASNNYLFFGEGAMQQGGGKALLIGTMASLHSNLDIAIVYRNYNSLYTNSLSNSFSNASSPTNENGVYVGATLKLKHGFKVLGYSDFFNSPQPKYRTNGASHGHDYASAIQYQPGKSFKLEMRYRTIVDEANISSSLGNTLGYLVEEQRSTLRFQCDYTYSKQLVFRTRFEQTIAGNEAINTQKGNMIFQDVRYASTKGRWGATFRYGLFNANGSGARMYSFEDDVPYTFSMVQLSGVGSRFYIMVNYKIQRKVEIWVRYSNSFYPDQNVIGSGLDAIQGNKRETIKLLLKINF